LKTRNLVIIGVGEMAEVAHYYFSSDSEYNVVGFAVEKQYLADNSFFGLPVTAFDDIELRYSPLDFDLFIAVGYRELNQQRARLYGLAREKGYRLATFISSRATFATNVSIGDNCFILEENTLQPFVTVGSNTFLWSGNHVGHHAKLGNHLFVTSHVVISGGVEIGDFCFIGVNATLRDHISIGEKSIIGAGALIMKQVGAGEVFVSQPTPRSSLSSSDIKL